MERIQDYEILEKLMETNDSSIFKGRKEGDNETVIVKVLKKRFHSISEIARFKQEYKTVTDIDLEGILKNYDIINHEGRIILVFEDIAGIYVSTYLEENNTFDIELFLKTGIRISETMGKFHKKNIIHRNINPHTLLLDLKTGMPRITGFGISSGPGYETLKYESGELQDSLFYISPEQTGRMNRIVDYRTDLYSLGATFYKMITGKTPFESKDPLEIIYAHIAREVIPPIEQKEEIPRVISDIIIKLMSKNADDRYQSAFGLMSDLSECLERLGNKSGIESFQIARHDISSRFIMPQKIFGRDKEIDDIISAFERVSGMQAGNESESGRAEIMLVAGSPGIGKSALINEIYKPIAERKGYFIFGEYRQFRNDAPYSAIIQAFQKLIKQVLSESNDKIEFIKKSINDALGSNGKIITDIIPELELIIGEQPEVVMLGPNETNNRFNIVFERFVSVFTGKEHPVVLFLDDLHRADPASLELVRNLAADYRMRHLLIIGTYRDNEVSEVHPLIKILKAICNSGIEISKITLSELSVSEVKDLLINFLKCSEEDGYSLAELIHRKTGGNPFFVSEFLHTLYDKKLIEIDSRSGWKWDIEKINHISITNNIVEFLSNRISQLTENLQDVLKICACIGNRFNPEILSILLEKPIDITLDLLAVAIDEGIISIMGDMYVFNHNKIQEAAYSLLSDEEKSLLHYSVGKLILEKTDTNKLFNKLFYIADQLNLGKKLITDSKEMEELARLNYDCGIKAKISSAFSKALSYFETGMGMLGESCWEDQYDLTLAIYSEAVETAFLMGDYNVMNRYASAVIDSARNIHDSIPVYETKIHAYDGQLDFQESIDIAFDVFKKLNYSISMKPCKLQIFTAMLKIRLYLFVRKIESLLDLPEMSDFNMLAVSRFLTYVSKGAYIISPDLFTYIVIKQIEHSIKYGQCRAQIIAYIEMAGILTCNFCNIDAGYKLGGLAIQLGKKLNARRYEARALSLYLSIIAHWKEHLRTVRPEFMRSYQTSLDTGDIEWTADSLFKHDYFGMLIGSPLSELELQMAKNHKAIEQLRQEHFFALHSIVWQTALNLLGKCGSPVELSGIGLDEEKMLPAWKASNTRTILGFLYVNRLMLRYLFMDYKKALDDSDTLAEYIDSLVGFACMRDYEFYSSLVRLMLYPEAGKRKKHEYKRFFTQSLKKFRKWAKHAPMNNEHRIYIIEAEKARISGNHKKAEIFYDKAIEMSRKNEYLIEEAIAYELAGKYYINVGKEPRAKLYLYYAYVLYKKWEAFAKVRQLEETYPEFVSQLDNSAVAGHGIPGKSVTTSQIVDINTVVKASQTISGEVILGKLLMKMMKIAMENAGARKGFIIFENKGNYFVEAEAEIGIEEVKVLNSIPVETIEDLSPSIVNYVTRTKEMLILDDALNEGNFINEPYVQKYKPKSILCAPISSRGKLIAVLYLENDLSTGTFTRERLEVLNILSSQMAISIENAKFYQKLEELVRERTEELEKSKKRFEDIAYSSADWFWESDNGGVFTYCSEKVEDILGYKPEEIIGKRAHDFMPEDEIEVSGAKIRDTVSRKEHFKDMESWHLTKSGKRVCTLTSGVPIFNNHDELNGYRGVDKDITERKQNEMKLQEIMKEISRSNQELEQFAYIISHDLQEPLRKIQKFSEGLKESRDFNNDKKSIDYLNRMQNAAERMKNLINGLLNYSRLTTKSQTFTEVDLNYILKDVISDLEIRIRETAASIEIEKLPVITADELQMRQLFQNLINNAIKFHRQEKVPVVKVYTLNEGSEDYHNIVVEDNGIGIDKKDHERIFGVFQRLHGRSDYEGTGIGLAICKKIVERHSGAITVDSKIEEGTKFKISLLKIIN